MAGIENFAYFAKNSNKILKFSIHAAQLMQVMPKHIYGPLSTVLACMLPELHAIKVLFYAESVGMVTFGHATITV